MDPAALGTTRIGLDGIRREQEQDDRGEAQFLRARQRSDRHPIRHRIAAVLHRAAASLDPAHANAYGASPSDG